MPKIVHRSEKGKGETLFFDYYLSPFQNLIIRKKLKTYLFENNIKCFELFLGLVLFDRNIIGF